MTIVMGPSCLRKKIGPNGLPAPTLGLCLNLFSSITADLKYPQHSGERYRINGHLVYLLFEISLVNQNSHVRHVTHVKRI